MSSREEQGGGKTCLVARGRLELEGTLDIRPGPGGVADDLHGTSPVHQGGGLTHRVIQGPGAFDGLVEQGDSRSTVTLIGREPPGAVEGVHPPDVVVGDQVEQVAQPPPSLREVAARGPEGREPVGQPQRGGRVRPPVEVQRGPEVVVFELEQVQAGLVRQSGGRARSFARAANAPACAARTRSHTGSSASRPAANSRTDSSIANRGPAPGAGAACRSRL